MPRDRSLLLLIFRDRSLVLRDQSLLPDVQRVREQQLLAQKIYSQNTNANLKQALFSPKKKPPTLPQLSWNNFYLENTLKHQISTHQESFLTLTFYSIFYSKAPFLSRFFSSFPFLLLFSLLFFPLYLLPKQSPKFENQRKGP